MNTTNQRGPLWLPVIAEGTHCSGMYSKSPIRITRVSKPIEYRIFWNVIIGFRLNGLNDSNADVSVWICDHILFFDSRSGSFTHIEGSNRSVWNKRQSQDILAQFTVGCDCNHVVSICLVGIVATIYRSKRMALCSILVPRNKSSFDLLFHNVSTAKGYRWGNNRFRKALLFRTSSLFLNCSILTFYFISSELFPLWQGIDFWDDSDAIHSGLCCSRCCFYKFKTLSQVHWNIHVRHVLVFPIKRCYSHQI